MSIKAKKKDFKFTFGVFIRLLVFTVLVVAGIKFLAGSIETKSESVLGDNSIGTTLPVDLDPVYELLPEDSKKQIDTLKSATTSAFVQQKLDYIKQELAGFPEKQIKEIQKQVVTNIYDNIINSIEKK